MMVLCSMAVSPGLYALLRVQRAARTLVPIPNASA
jgi:hypothetical protein